VGLFGLASARSATGAFAAATIFGAGISYFWPVMLGFTTERFPKTGPLGLAIMGGTGQLAAAFVLPVMGRWYDAHGAAAAFEYVAFCPVVLTIAFAILFFKYRATGGYQPVLLDSEELASAADARSSRQ
jgi:hypothetical protein